MITFADADLASYKWRNRVLVILAPSNNDPQLKEQCASAAASAAGFAERDLLVITEIVEGPIHRKFGIRQSDFQVLLIGKDGRSTLQWPKPVSPEVIFSAIDRMPMRRDEMSKQKDG
jgi:hypothetical protein